MDFGRNFTPSSVRGSLLLSIRGINIASVADSGIITIPPVVQKFRIKEFFMVNASVTPIAGQVAVYTAASAGGTNIVAAALITDMSAATIIHNSSLVAGVSTTAFSVASIYVRTTILNVAALTLDAYLLIDDLT